MTDYRVMAAELTERLALAAPPIAITFSEKAPANVAGLAGTMPTPTADGRTGRAAASCVFWMKATAATFTTTAADHGNCSVGAYTHGFKTLAEAAQGADVAALVASEWVSPGDFPMIAAVQDRPGAITYGPLADTPLEPSVVFLRLNAKQAMMLHDAWPELRVEGKPQCHILAIAKDGGEIALSVGCMLSRVRTGMRNDEMTCAIPAARLSDLLARLRAAAAADRKVAAYAAADARRFS